MLGITQLQGDCGPTCSQKSPPLRAVSYVGLLQPATGPAPPGALCLGASARPFRHSGGKRLYTGQQSSSLHETAGLSGMPSRPSLEDR